MNWYKKAIFELSFGANSVADEITNEIKNNFNIIVNTTILNVNLKEFLGLPSSRYIPKDDSPYNRFKDKYVDIELHVFCDFRKSDRDGIWAEIRASESEPKALIIVNFDLHSSLKIFEEEYEIKPVVDHLYNLGFDLKSILNHELTHLAIKYLGYEPSNDESYVVNSKHLQNLPNEKYYQFYVSKLIERQPFYRNIIDATKVFVETGSPGYANTLLSLINNIYHGLSARINEAKMGDNKKIIKAKKDLQSFIKNIYLIIDSFDNEKNARNVLRIKETINQDFNKKRFFPYSPPS
jgi:hypothetical protein